MQNLQSKLLDNSVIHKVAKTKIVETLSILLIRIWFDLVLTSENSENLNQVFQAFNILIT